MKHEFEQRGSEHQGSRHHGNDEPEHAFDARVDDAEALLDARLVAHLFGELPPGPAAELEAELAASPELETRRATLAATAALVRGALPPEALSAELRATLGKAAAARAADTRAAAHRAGFTLVPPAVLRAAVGLAATGLGLLALRPWLAGPKVETLGETARAEVREEARFERTRVDATRQLPAAGARPMVLPAREGRGSIFVTRMEGADGAATSLDVFEHMDYFRQGSGGLAGVEPLSRARTTVAPSGGLDGVVLGETLLDRDALRALVDQTGAALDLDVEVAQGAFDLQYPSRIYSVQPSTGQDQTVLRLGLGGGAGGGLPQTQTLTVGLDAFGLDGNGTGSTVESPSTGFLYAGAAVAEDPYELRLMAQESGEPMTAEALRGRLATPQTLGGETRVPLDRQLELVEAKRALLEQAAAQGLLREELQATDVLYRRVVDGLEPREGESAGQLFFRYWGDNPWVATADQALSTFAADADTGSFGVVRRVLRAGALPRPEQVRTEELVNWWRPDVPPPSDGSDFRLVLEAAPSRFGPAADTDGEAVLLRVALRGRDVDRRARKPLALTLVVDESGSMDDHGRIQLVRDAVALLLRELSTTDSLALVTFGTEARTLVPMTSAANRGPFEDALADLDPDGGTNVEAGLVAGYELAAAELTPGAVNRVVFLSDGVGNVGETDQARILERVAAERAAGVYLTTIGVGYGVDDNEEYADDFLEQLADRGDGLYHNVNDAADAERYLVDQFTESLEPIARDVKLQLELDPAQVASWRQLGYENRALTAQQFRDDAVDAGEVHAGHQVNALYELRLRPGAAADAPLAVARVRWKQPFAVDAGRTDAAAAEAAEVATEREATLPVGAVARSYADTSLGYRRAALVAQLAELLRRSEHARGDAPAELLSEMEALAPFLADADFDELLGLLRDARGALQALAAELGPIDHKVDEIRRRQVDLLAERERLAAEAEADARARRQAEVDRLRAEIDRLEGELRDLLAGEFVPPDEAR